MTLVDTTAPALAVVVHYSEIGLKGKNRGMFIGTLLRNIRDALDGVAPGARVEGMYGRLMIHLTDPVQEVAVRERLRWIPGIANFSFAKALSIRRGYDFDATWKAMAEEAWRIAVASNAQSFALRARRADKTFPKMSLEVERELGGHVFERARAENHPLKVHLDAPELTIHVEIAPPFVFVYGIKESAPGGLPVGSSGKLVSLLSAGFDSPVASYLMMKRGAQIVYVHFHSHPLTDRRSVESARDLVETLGKVQLKSRLYLVPFGYAQQEMIQVSPRTHRMVLYRRMMMRIASEVARRERGMGLVTGESLGQVASQTLSNMAAIDDSADFPVYRPLIGMNKDEIIAMADRLGTHATSTEQVPDCCSLMVARHPATKSTIAEVEAMEAAYDVPRLVSESLERAEVEDWGRRGRRSVSIQRIPDSEPVETVPD